MNLKEKVIDFLKNNSSKSYRAWEIAENLWVDKEEVTKIIKELKKENKVEGRCAYKLAN